MTEPVLITHDFETRSYADLKQVGAWAYSENPTTEAICLCWAVGEGPVEEWWPGKTKSMPESLRWGIENGALFEAHNAAFEYSIWQNVMSRHGWSMPSIRQFRDSMAVAAYYAMPQALDRLAAALRMPGKSADGGKLISKYCKLHLKTARPIIPPEDHRRILDYCAQDVRVEREISNYLGDLPEEEMENFFIDFEMNVKGLKLDLRGIDVATKIVKQRALELTQKFEALTGMRPTQLPKFKLWLEGHGLKLENLRAEELEELLEEGDVPQGPARRALEIRLRINKASTKKLDSMARQASVDGRARFQTRYHGAGTGRNTGTGFQPLNLTRGYEKMDPEQLVRDIMHGDAAWLDCLYGDAMVAVGNASRYWIQAEKGHRIIAADLVSVEAVGLACLAGEQWKIEAFRNKAKIYELMGDKIHGLPPGTVTKETHPAERQDGKTGELAFGYGGALNAWLNFDNSGRHTDERIVEICKTWRKEHPAIVHFWRELELAAIEAVRRPGVETCANGGPIGFRMFDEWLAMILPDGKRIWYREPQLRMKMPPWHKPLEFEDCASGGCRCEPMPALTYTAQKAGQWKRVYTYGGKLAENATQAACRQLLRPMIQAVRDAGYTPILSVYDEVVSEVREDFGSKDEFMQIMLDAKPAFAYHWPISVEAWEGGRYKK